MPDVIDHSDFQNSFNVSMTCIIKSESSRVRVLHVSSRVRVRVQMCWTRVRVQQDRDSSPTRVRFQGLESPSLPSYCSLNPPWVSHFLLPHLDHLYTLRSTFTLVDDTRPCCWCCGCYCCCCRRRCCCCFDVARGCHHHRRRRRCPRCYVSGINCVFFLGSKLILH